MRRLLWIVVVMAVPVTVFAQSFTPEQETLIEEVQTALAQQATWLSYTQVLEYDRLSATTIVDAEGVSWMNTTTTMQVISIHDETSIVGDATYRASIVTSEDDGVREKTDSISFLLVDDELLIDDEVSEPNDYAQFEMVDFVETGGALRSELLSHVLEVYDLGITNQDTLDRVQGYDLVLDFLPILPMVNFDADAIAEQYSDLGDAESLRELILANTDVRLQVNTDARTGQLLAATLVFSIVFDIPTQDGLITIAATHQQRVRYDAVMVLEQ